MAGSGGGGVEQGVGKGMQVKRGELGGGGPAGARGPGPCLLPRVASTPGWSMWKAMAFRPGQAPHGAPAGWTLSTSSLPHSTGAHPGGLPHDVPQPLVRLRDGGQRTGPGGEPAIPGLSGGRHPGSASGRLEGGVGTGKDVPKAEAPQGPPWVLALP